MADVCKADDASHYKVGVLTGWFSCLTIALVTQVFVSGVLDMNVFR